jgi:hypothetical protein
VQTIIFVVGVTVDTHFSKQLYVELKPKFYSSLSVENT